MDAILLAAGNSTRFGKNKLLYRLDGKPMYRYILELLYEQKKENVLDHVIVVSQYDEIFDDIRTNFPGVETVKNPAPELGISGSIRLGLAHLEQVIGKEQVAGRCETQKTGRTVDSEPEADSESKADKCGQKSKKSEACLFTVADQPFISLESLVKLEQCYRESAAEIVAAVHDDWIGNPVIFSEKYYEELKCLSGDTGGKKVLRRHMDDVGFCEIPARELEDMDTQEAVGRFEQEQNRTAAPGQEPQVERKETAEDNQKALLEDSFPFLKEAGHIISIVGGGGKTTLMYTLAKYYADRGMRVIAATTTHIRRPSDHPVASDRAGLAELLKKYFIVVAGADAPGNKLKMPEKMTVSDYKELADVVLIEADGAKCLPCKVPVEKEPVIPKESDIVIGVMGMDTVGKPLGEICFRKERAMELLAVEEQHPMTTEDMAKILSSDRGTRKGVGNREYYVVLNKCDDKQRMRQGKEICELLAGQGVENTVCIALQRYMLRESEFGK